MSLELPGQTYSIAIVFFGLHCLLISYLTLRSDFRPRFLGGLMVIAGLGWLTYLSPPLARSLSPCFLPPGILGEGALTLWLLVLGVNVPRWLEQGGRGAAPHLQ